MTDTVPETGGRQRRLLPLLTPRHGGRSAMTCKYRCGDACFHEVPNTSENEYFGDLVDAGMTRRGLLRSGAAAALVLGTGTAGALATPTVAAAAPAPAAVPGIFAGRGSGRPERNRPIGFTAVRDNTVDSVVVPNGYDWSTLIAWGDPVERGAPDFDFENQSARAQRRQFGYNADFVGVIPLDRRGNRALLWVNHEYTNEELMFRGWQGPESATEEQLRIAMAAHGGSIVEIGRVGDTGEWRREPSSRYNRRLHTETEMRLVGPAAGSDLLATSADPDAATVLGMLNNCAGGLTPWGTVLTAEENFNQYFGASAAVSDPTAVQRYGRYGIRTDAGTSRGWEQVDDRFDLTAEPNEPNRFGWIVEIDPFDPDSTPRKLTALGRVKHEGATTAITEDGRVAVYLGDDERFDYVYKFLSKERYRAGSSSRDRRHNLGLLEQGDLYVARLTGDSPEFPAGAPADGVFDGIGEWIPLVVDGESQVPGMDVDEVLVFTRLAADAVQATKMDRPEDVERNPVTGTVYLALTNNAARSAAQRDEANPRAANKHGHIIGLDEDGNDPGALSFTWSILILAGNPEDPDTYYGGYDKSQVSTISCPDNVAFDPSGRLWIATDGMPGTTGINDGMFAVPVEGAERGHLRRFLSVPFGAECCGPFITADGRSALVAIQHPGEGDGASPETPLSTFPYGDQPRPAVVTIWRKAPAGGFIGD